MAEFLMHSPMREEFGGSKEMYMLLRELPMMVEMLWSKLQQVSEKSVKVGESSKPPLQF
jgi:hypothetical protein